MKPTSIPRVSLTKSVFTRFSTLLNPPRSLSPAESRKFLSLIKESFRTSLAASTPSNAPTDDHLNSILTTEPFTIIPTTKEDRINRFLQDPIGTFDEQCLAGKADVDLAAVCLSKFIQLEKERADRTDPVPRELKWSAVSSVLDGLKNAGLGAPKDVLANPKLAKVVAEGLVLEGKEKHFVMWSKMTSQEAPLPARQNMVNYGIQSVVTHYGWERGIAMFRDVLAGVRMEERFTKREYAAAGLMLCQTGMDQGFGESLVYRRLIVKCAIWASHWQMQAWVCLKYGKKVGVGVSYFKNFLNRPGEWVHRGLRYDFWIRQEFPLDLVKECLAQRRLEDAVLIKGVVESRFVGCVTQDTLDSMKRSIEEHMAGVEAAGGAEVAGGVEGKSENLQGGLNALG